jgi:2-hydroxymuconate-semialdehyde hydrolase
MSSPIETRSGRFEGLSFRYLEGGSGFPILMLHGVGPGTSILGNFGPVLEPLAARFHVIGIDLVGFGGSDRKQNEPYFDVDLWVRQAIASLDLFPAGPVGIIGHSMGGALALKAAARSPRIAKVMTSCTVGVPYPINSALNDFWSRPRDPAHLRQIMARMVHAAGTVTDAMIDDRWDLLNQPGYPDYFGKLFAEPRQRLLDAAVLSDEEIGRIEAEVMMLHGRNDQPCPPDQTTLVLARKLPQADVHLLARSGHNLPRERSAAFLAHAFTFFGA